MSGYDEWEEWGDWDDGAGWLGALAPLRADVLSGDLRLFYLLWLGALERGELEDDETEPLPGIEPLTGALEALAAGDPHVATEVRSRVRKIVALAPGETYTKRRTVADLRSRAAARCATREAIKAERRETERQRRHEEAEEARRL